MILVIDYGIGNLRSVQKAIQRYYPDVIISSKQEDIIEANGIVLPGVGAFGDTIDDIKEKGLFELLKQVLPTKPTLGICLGMQILLNSSEESPGYEGLGIIPGQVKKLKALNSIHVPHTGWNRIFAVKEPSFSGFAYFNHTYYCDVEDNNLNVAYTLHGIRFGVILKYGKILLTQFHPEKSKNLGEKILKYWVNTISTEVNQS